ncbi:ATP-dependent helicase HrpB [Sporocytophaga myxococcoides]|uniref:ATP-dependent helicase HrpB n=1 Tax=Sporocytophaga myxococcoides TaxID=153721 RepID=UPI00041CB577|nr:ATP-dependent helicase HrpB [Sporocytophaga myxococcoides]
MSFNPLSIDLPVREIIPAVQEHLSKSNTLIVNAPPGAGKSTLLPLAIFNEPWLEGKKVLMLEPRRLAAKTIAERMSSLLGEDVGQSIGYRIRFENKVSNKTRIEVLTEGILTRFIHNDNSLEGVGLVIFDEFHERSIHADVAMALCREAQQRLRPDLRIMVMSATLDMPQLTKILKAPVAQSQGKQYPVEIKYTGEADQFLLPEMTAKVVIKAVKEKDGDTLVFLPGEADIKQCEGILKKELKGFVIHPLYGMLPPGKQYSAIMPDKTGKRKVVLATSIAETSLTIEGIKIVVDSGFGKTSKFDPQSGLSRLVTQRISKDSADQRAGRAGRLSPGTCYRMWSESIQENMTEHRIPEIMEADLSSLVLDMAQWGIVDPHQLTWLSPPPKATLAQAVETLHQLNALENGRITEHGKKIHSLPCHPRIAHMLLMAEEENRLPLATDLAALLEERDPLKRETGIDINVRIEALRRYRKEKGQGKQLGRIEKVAASYRKLFDIKEDNGQQDPYETGVLLAHCHPERIAFARPGNNAQFQLANGKYASASHKDELAHESWLAIANLDAREGMGKIFLASPLNPKDLAPLVKEQEVISWDTEDGTLKASKDLRIGSIILKSKPLPAPNDKFRIKAISDAIKKEGDFLLPFTEEVKEWQERILQLKKSEPQAGWPDVSTSTLLLTNYEWLTPHLTDIEHPDDLYELDLLDILQKFLTKEQKERLL